MCVIHDTIQTGSIHDLSRERNRNGRGFGAVEVWRQTANVMLQGGSDHRHLYIDRMSSYLFFFALIWWQNCLRDDKNLDESHTSKGPTPGFDPCPLQGGQTLCSWPKENANKVRKLFCVNLLRLYSYLLSEGVFNCVGGRLRCRAVLICLDRNPAIVIVICALDANELTLNMKLESSHLTKKKCWGE